MFKAGDKVIMKRRGKFGWMTDYTLEIKPLEINKVYSVESCRPGSVRLAGSSLAYPYGHFDLYSKHDKLSDKLRNRNVKTIS